GGAVGVAGAVTAGAGVVVVTAGICGFSATLAFGAALGLATASLSAAAAGAAVPPLPELAASLRWATIGPGAWWSAACWTSTAPTPTMAAAASPAAAL